MKNKNDNIIYGIHPLIEAIQAGKEFDKIFIKKNLNGSSVSDLLNLIKKHNLTYQMVPIERLNRITRKNHQGVIAYVSPVSFSNIEMIIPTLFEEGKSPVILILDKITDVRNFGAICRTAECSGVDAIVYPEKESALLNADAVKSAAGAMEYIPICKVKNLTNTVKYLKDSGLQIVACTEKSNCKYTEINYTIPTAIIMGSEGEGISTQLLKMSDTDAYIPLLGNIGSLNVSCATAIILYEIVRQKTL